MAAPDVIGRDFTASEPNLRWSADIPGFERRFPGLLQAVGVLGRE